MRLPSDAAERKAIPIGTGVIDYFPDALIEVAKVSKAGNDQHNPGMPLQWSRDKSDDHSDCIMRHYLDRYEMDGELYEAAKMAWRSLAFLQILIESKQDETI